jgi:hypothetical protein
MHARAGMSAQGLSPRLMSALVIVAARLVSGLSGYVVLAFAANRLTAGQFAELALFQTIVFLVQITFDSGLVQYANQRVAGQSDWRGLVGSFQHVRYAVHLVAATVMLAVWLLGGLASADPWLAPVCALALLSTPLNADWVLVSRQQQNAWAAKAMLCGAVNVAASLIFLMLGAQPSAVLGGVVATNLAGGLYLYGRGFVGRPGLGLPTTDQLRGAAQLSISGMLVHGGYNLPMLAVTAWVGGIAAGSYACLYRIFSAATLFVPPVVDFAVAREIAAQTQRTPPQGLLHVWLRLVPASVALVLPVLLTPVGLLHQLIGLAIDLPKFQIQPEHFQIVKLALLGYCIDLCAQRSAYVLNRRRLLLAGTALGLAAGLGAIALALRSAPAPAAWFHAVLAFQVCSSATILAAGAFLHHRRSRAS